MSRPEVSIDSVEKIDELYNYYELHEQSQLYARAAHYLISKVYRPTVSFAEDGAAKEAIQEQLQSKARLINTSNHLTGDDQYVIVAVAEQEETFHPLRGNTFIPTEPSLSTANWRRGGQLLRRAVDGLGSIPIVRLEDFSRRGIEITPELRELHRYAMLRADQTEVSKMIHQGVHMAGFPEGTRNRTDHRVVQNLKLGIGHTACNAAQKVDVAIVPWGMYYGGEPKSYKKLDVPKKYTPHVHIGMPISVETSSPEALMNRLGIAIQECVDVAVEHFDAKAE